VKVVLEADGGARGNPGPAGYGAVIRDAGTGAVLAERWESLGTATNNAAEYAGLIAGLRAARELGATEVDVRMDSKLVIEQMTGRWQIKHPGLRPLAAQAAALVGEFTSVTFQWVPRDRNQAADALANKAMDTAQPRWDPPSEPATRFVLIRHGQTAYTAEGRYSGRGDIPLSDAGEAQVASAAGRVSALGPVAAVYSSPLSRCTRTAAVVSARLDPQPDVIAEPDLIECDFGDWEGLTFAEVRQKSAAALNSWLASTSMAPPGGESFEQVATRVRRVIGRLRSAHPAQTLVIVSHVSPIKLMLRDALAAGDALLHRLYLDPAGISIVDAYPDGGVAVRSVNETGHLTPA